MCICCCQIIGLKFDNNRAVERVRLAWSEVGGDVEDHVIGGRRSAVVADPWLGVDGLGFFVQPWLSVYAAKRLAGSERVLLAS